VVEVGIDVPNATVMTILDADRLGLAQLHQLRGRVGRGRHSGFVCAFTSLGGDARDNERLMSFERTSDGFELAELDLKLRGAGDLIGTRQHGASLLRIADLARDGDAVLKAQAVAREILATDPELADASLQRLKRQVLHRHGNWLGLSDVG
jgi:ATP-dependent DNA helicase RecG